MVSSEMPELLGVCDRILVMSGGRLAGEVDAKTATQEEIMTLCDKICIKENYYMTKIFSGITRTI